VSVDDREPHSSVLAVEGRVGLESEAELRRNQLGELRVLGPVRKHHDPGVVLVHGRSDIEDAETAVALPVHGLRDAACVLACDDLLQARRGKGVESLSR